MSSGSDFGVRKFISALQLARNTSLSRASSAPGTNAVAGRGIEARESGSMAVPRPYSLKAFLRKVDLPQAHEIATRTTDFTNRGCSASPVGESYGLSLI
jgi:hypothetical protein